MTTVVKIVAESYDRWWAAELVSEDKSNSCRLSCQFCFDWKTLSANVQFFRKIVNYSKFFEASPLQENLAPIIFNLNDKKCGNIIFKKLDVLKCQKKNLLIWKFFEMFLNLSRCDLMFSVASWTCVSNPSPHPLEMPKCPQRCWSILSRTIFSDMNNSRTYFSNKIKRPQISIPVPSYPKTLLSSNMWGMSTTWWKKPKWLFRNPGVEVF